MMRNYWCSTLSASVLTYNTLRLSLTEITRKIITQASAKDVHRALFLDSTGFLTFRERPFWTFPLLIITAVLVISSFDGPSLTRYCSLWLAPTTNSREYNRKIRVTHTRSHLRKSFSMVMVIEHWNRLLVEVITVPSEKSSKNDWMNFQVHIQTFPKI